MLVGRSGKRCSLSLAYLDVREGGGRELVRVVAGVLGLRVRLVDEVLDLVVDVDRSHGSSGRD